MAPSSTPDADLRAALRETPPSDFPVRQAWRETLRCLRAVKRETGRRPNLTGWGDVERALARPAPSAESVGELKRLLRRVQRSDDSPDAAVRIDALVAALAPAVATEPVELRFEGWPEDFPPPLQARLLRLDEPPPVTLSPEAAAALVREFDGFVLAGRTVRARPPEGLRLPSVPRAIRAQPPRRERTGPWLPHVDAIGRRSLTPRELADRQARRLAAEAVVDGYCGLGGNAISFARAGARVLAVERDPARLALARRNAQALGVADRIDFRQGDIDELLPTLPKWPLFLDPPWLGLTIDRLPIPLDRPVMLKLPRDADVRELPGTGWRVDYEFGERGDDFNVVRMLTVSRRP